MSDAQSWTLRGKTAVVTGSTRGFGLAMARAFVSAGANVVVTSRTEEAVREAAAALNQMREGAADGIPCDVGVFDQVAALRDYALTQFGGLDIWVNNAGIAGPYGPTAHLPVEAFQRVVTTNILGTYHGARAALAHFLPQDHGKLINILGHGEKGPVAMQNAYASSKYWVRNFTLTLAKEVVGDGVGIYALNPGMMVTDLLTDIDVIAGYEERLEVFPTVIRIFSQPMDIPAQKAVWLASSATDGRTGLVVRATSFATMLVGALREGVRRLLGRPAPPAGIRIHTIPSSLDANPDPADNWA